MTTTRNPKQRAVWQQLETLNRERCGNNSKQNNLPQHSGPVRIFSYFFDSSGCLRSPARDPGGVSPLRMLLPPARVNRAAGHPHRHCPNRAARQDPRPRADRRTSCWAGPEQPHLPRSQDVQPRLGPRGLIAGPASCRGRPTSGRTVTVAEYLPPMLQHYDSEGKP